jgi:hypothetical protein
VRIAMLELHSARENIRLLETEQKLHEILAGVGHDTQKVRAKDEDYAKVPGCCKYRTLEKH